MSCSNSRLSPTSTSVQSLRYMRYWLRHHTHQLYWEDLESRIGGLERVLDLCPSRAWSSWHRQVTGGCFPSQEWWCGKLFKRQTHHPADVPSTPYWQPLSITLIMDISFSKLDLVHACTHADTLRGWIQRAHNNQYPERIVLLQSLTIWDVSCTCHFSEDHGEYPAGYLSCVYLSRWHLGDQSYWSRSSQEGTRRVKSSWGGRILLKATQVCFPVEVSAVPWTYYHGWRVIIEAISLTGSRLLSAFLYSRLCSAWC